MAVVPRTNDKDRRGESADDRKDPSTADHHRRYLYRSYAYPACTNDGEGVLYKTKASGTLIPGSYAGDADDRVHRQRTVCQRRTVLSVGKRVEHLEAADQPKDDVELDDARVRKLFRAVIRTHERPSIERRIHPLRRDDDPSQRRRRKKGYDQVLHVGVQLGKGKRTSGPIVRLHARTWRKIGSQLSKRVHRHSDHRRLRKIQSGRSHDQRALYWAHARRYFVDALEGIEEETGDSIAYRLLVQIAKIFHIEAKLQKRRWPDRDGKRRKKSRR